MRKNGAFGGRLKAVLRDGNLRVADLARWFDVPHPTVRGWVVDGWNPGGGPRDQAYIYRMLDVLELCINQKRGFPIPRLSPRGRIAHLAEIRQAVIQK